MKSHRFIFTLLLFLASDVSAQRVDPSALHRTPPPPHIALDIATRPAADPKPPISRAAMAMQAVAGGAGGLAGAFVAFVPLALKEFGGSGSNVSDNVAAGVVIAGYYVGTVAGVQAYSNRALGLNGSWKATFLGAALGILGGPAVLFTMPIGATIGFNKTRRAR